MRYFDPRELNDLMDLAGRGGIGKGIALTDCVAEAPDQLMYIKGDELILLRELDDVLLASCEGIVGWVETRNVKFDSLAGTSSPPHAGATGLPKTILTAPSPPMRGTTLPGHDASHQPEGEISKTDLRRISGPFELESPQPSPHLGKENEGFFSRKEELPRNSGGSQQTSSVARAADGPIRDSVVSTTSSDAFGGIGGFMMGGAEDNDSEHSHEEENRKDTVEELQDDRSPVSPTITTPFDSTTRPMARQVDTASLISDPSKCISADTIDADGEDDEEDGNDTLDESEWDIYNDYARESMYGPAKRMSLAVQQRRLSRAAKAASKPSPLSRHENAPLTTEEFRLPSASKRIQPQVPDSATQEDDDVVHVEEEQDTESANSSDSKPNTADKHGTSAGTGQARSVATELRLRILRERELDRSQPGRERGSIVVSEQQPDQRVERGLDTVDRNTSIRSSNVNGNASMDGLDTSDESAMLVTPDGSIVTSLPLPPSEDGHAADLGQAKNNRPGMLMASPLPNDESEQIHVSDAGIISAPTLVPPPPSTNSPTISPRLRQTPWTSSSPSSPHSIAATKQAVEAGRSVSDGQRSRGLTLVGRIETDLLASKGPVPITFLVNGPGMPVVPTPPSAVWDNIGLGLPSTSERSSPAIPPDARRAHSPLASPIIPDEYESHNQSSPFPPHPQPVRRATTPLPPAAVPAPVTPLTPDQELAKPSPPFAGGRPRARSFSATVAKTLGVGRKDATPPLSIVTGAGNSPVSNSLTPPVPIVATPMAKSSSQTSSSTKRSFFGGRKSSLAPSTPPPPVQGSSSRPSAGVPSEQSTSINSQAIPLVASTSATVNSASSVSSIPPVPPAVSERSPSFSLTAKSAKTPRKGPRVLPSPVSHKDYAEETVKAEGLDFELIQPRKGTTLLSPGALSPSSPSSDGRSPLSRMNTLTSQNSSSSLKPLPETDEWGFLKEQSPVPEIFQSRSAPGDHRAIEQKWLSIISVPLPPNSQAPKKVKKLVLDAGVPASLRGKVWAWYMAHTLSARTPGLYQELIEHDNGLEDDRIDKDIAGAYPDHSIFSVANSPGQADLRSILRAYSNFAPAGYRPEMALIAGALLIHCVAEDSFWLLSGLVNSVLKDYFTKERTGVRIDAAVLMGLLKGLEPKLAKLFRETGVHAISFVDKWFSQLFIRCLPWPTALRVIDAVVSEGPRFLLIASLTILSQSRERLLALPQDPSAILGYLHDLPQDSLLLPEVFMRAAEAFNGKFDEKEYRKLKAGVEKEIMG
ncbi:hypothetical protein IAU60_003795 [Kwoniella sp. DSM 27419]